MHTAQGYSLGAVDYILTPVVPEILRTKVGVFVDLYRKTQQVKRQAEERVALAREQAARAAAEEATRRSAFLAEASTVLVRSLDYEAIPRGLAGQAVPFLGDLCAVALLDEAPGPAGGPSWRGSTVRMTRPSRARRRRTWSSGRSTELIRHVSQTGVGDLPPGRSGRGPSGSGPRRRRHADRPARSCATARGPRTGLAPHSVLAVPLCARGHCLGAIALAVGEGREPFGPDEVSLARDLAGRAAIAIDNARLYRDVQENNRRKNEFLAMLAHELRNPLAPIRNAAEILRDARHPGRRPALGQRRHRAARSSTSSAWSTTCSTSRGSPAGRSSSASSRSTSPSPSPAPSRPAGR